jgi:rSAM/selenodomain-associated transferase 2
MLKAGSANIRDDTQRLTDALKFSIVIAVLNEARRINALIEHITSLSPTADYEIIVIDGDPQGTTINTIDNNNVITAIAEKGRAKQMNAGAALAAGDVIIFLHADTELPPGAFGSINHALADGEYVGGAFALGVDSNNPLIRLTVAASHIRNHLTHIPYGDQAIFMRKKYFNEIGRFSNIPIMEDVELMRRIKKSGRKISILNQKVKTSTRRWENEGVVYTLLRNIVLVTLFYLGVDPNKLTRFYKADTSKGA